MRISDWSSDVCSSDLVADIDWDAVEGATRVLLRTYERFPHRAWDSDFTAIASEVVARLGAMGVRLIGTDAARSEEHTSELQSLMRISYAVFCLKKKTHEENIKYKNSLNIQECNNSQTVGLQKE